MSDSSRWLREGPHVFDGDRCSDRLLLNRIALYPADPGIEPVQPGPGRAGSGHPRTLADMAVATLHTSAPPEAVWAVLADGWMYSNWVVGTSHMRAVEADWPQRGSRLFHASGLWPAVRRDETVVEASEPPRRLVLTAKARPFGEARVSVELAPEGTGCRITIEEHPSAGPGRWVHNPAADRLLKHRNDEALARLRALAERRQRPAD